MLFLQSKPIIVNIPPDPPKSELSGLADVLLGSLGLTGIIGVAAVLLGAVMAGVMFWVRSRSSGDDSAGAPSISPAGPPSKRS